MGIEHKLRTKDFAYYLPGNLIAQEPLQRRDNSRLLVLGRNSGAVEHSIFAKLPLYLQAGDLLLLNDTRVLPARLLGRKKDSGGQVELLLLHSLSGNRWEVLCSPGKRVKPGAKLVFGEGKLEADVLEKTAAGGRIVLFKTQQPLNVLFKELGQVPLPPYIKKPLEDGERYQTVHADKEGSSAAPTAGLHFTAPLFAELKARGVQWAYLTLHIGVGTFRPVKDEYLEDHIMHAEFFELPAATAQMINGTRDKGGRIIAVGTTCCRVLETLGDTGGKVRAGQGETDLFIYPGYDFRVVDALITNFHLPCSTLLMLVSAFAGRENILAAYKKAIEKEYRFYSFGDAMLII